MVLLGGSDGKESTCSVGDLDSILGLGRSPGGGHGNPLQYSCQENPQGPRSLEGYHPWGLKELDTMTTQQQRVCVCVYIYIYIYIYIYNVYCYCIKYILYTIMIIQWK